MKWFPATRPDSCQDSRNHILTFLTRASEKEGNWSLADLPFLKSVFGLKTVDGCCLWVWIFKCSDLSFLTNT